MKTAGTRNPGDPDARTLVEQVIRVDQAGEFGAVRIYEGQLAALRWRGKSNSDAARKIVAEIAEAGREQAGGLVLASNGEQLFVRTPRGARRTRR